MLEPAAREANVILDLTNAKYVSSTLVMALVVLHEHRAERGMPTMIIVVKSAFVRRLLNLTGLEAFFRIRETIEEGLAELRFRESA